MQYAIPTESRQIATIALMRYKQNLKDLRKEFDIATTHSAIGSRSGAAAPPEHYQSSTERSAVRLADNPRYQRLKREIQAVETATDRLDPDQYQVIYRRFIDHPSGCTTPRAYDYLQDSGYSVRQMKRIVQAVIVSVAAALGEI